MTCLLVAAVALTAGAGSAAGVAASADRSAVGAGASDATGDAAWAVSDGHAAQSNESVNESANATDRFTLDADVVRRCGRTCRIVAANLTNVGNDTASNVTTETRIAAGDATLWERTDDVGNVSANESVTETARVRFGVRDVVRVQRNDGRIRIETTVRWDGGNETFTDRRRVG